jgi:HD-like signal output (HDOD) protein
VADADVETPDSQRLLDDLGRRLLKRRVDALKNLPTFPESILRINELITRDDPMDSMERIAQVIETDPVVCARLLRLVNSAFYGLSRTVVTVHDALLLLGLDIVKGLILSTSVIDILGGRRDGLAGLWEHSFGAAVAAGALGRTLGLPRVEELSAAALMHDLGKVVLASQLPEYRDVVGAALADRIPIREAERSLLGVTHDEIGQWLVSRWRFPPVLAEPIALHHEPAKARRHADATAVVHVADQLIRAYGFGFGGDAVMTSIDPSAWRLLSLTPEKIRGAVRRMHEDLLGAVAHVNLLLPT